MFIIDTGTAAIDGTHVMDVQTSTAQAVIATPLKVPKTSAVLALLQREDGASVSELIELTGWLSHTTRAALTGLRKKGHVIERSKRDEQTCYRIAAAA
jgi:DNA-binding MarR family transcriptional regulator